MVRNKNFNPKLSPGKIMITMIPTCPRLSLILYPGFLWLTFNFRPLQYAGRNVYSPVRSSVPFKHCLPLWYPRSLSLSLSSDFLSPKPHWASRSPWMRQSPPEFSLSWFSHSVKPTLQYSTLCIDHVRRIDPILAPSCSRYLYNVCIQIRFLPYLLNIFVKQ